MGSVSRKRVGRVVGMLVGRREINGRVVVRVVVLLALSGMMVAAATGMEVVEGEGEGEGEVSSEAANSRSTATTVSWSLLLVEVMEVLEVVLVLLWLECPGAEVPSEMGSLEGMD